MASLIAVELPCSSQHESSTGQARGINRVLALQLLLKSTRSFHRSEPLDPQIGPRPFRIWAARFAKRSFSSNENDHWGSGACRLQWFRDSMFARSLVRYQDEDLPAVRKGSAWL